MDSHSFEYKGHMVAVVVVGSEREQWGWTYSIDSGETILSRTHTMPGAVEAVEKAARHARRCIDGMPKQ